MRYYHIRNGNIISEHDPAKASERNTVELYDLYCDGELLERALYITEIEPTMRKYMELYAKNGRYPSFDWVKAV